MALKATTIAPPKNQSTRGLLVLLHGWGANYQDLLGLSSYMDLPDYQLVFPDAPFPHPYNPIGRMWYDLPADYCFFGQAAFADRPDLTTSRQLLTDFLVATTEATGIPLQRTILGGFSQGGAMTLDVGLRLPLAGLMVLSGYLHAPIQATQTSLPPVLMLHGRQDTVVSIAAAQQSRDALQALGIPLRYREYDMGHEISPIVLTELQAFVKEILP